MVLSRDSSNLEVQIKKVEELSDEHWSVWEQFRQADSGLDSPFFSREFVRAASRSSDNVRIGILMRQDSIQGFWPFELQGRTGKPIAAAATEMNGLIANPELTVDLSRLLGFMQLDRWHFDCVPTRQGYIAPFVMRNSKSRQVSLQGGWEVYRRSMVAEGSNQFRRYDQKIRKVERELGKTKWVWQSDNLQLLDVLTVWKRNQYRRSGMADVISRPEVQRLLKQLIEQRTEEFGGMLSALFVNGEPIAIHYGLRDRQILASWFHAYDPKFSKYSPGRIALSKLIQSAAEHKVERIDFGQGDEDYKRNLCNASITTGEGVVSRRRIDRVLLQAWIHAREFASVTPFCRVPLQWYRRFRNQQRQTLSSAPMLSESSHN